MDSKIIAIIIVSAAFALGRLGFPGLGHSPIVVYMAFAHIWVGFLIGIAFIERYRRTAIVSVVLISLLELVAAIAFRLGA